MVIGRLEPVVEWWGVLVMRAVIMGLYGRPCSFSWAIYSLTFYNGGECVLQYFVSWEVGGGGLELKFGISRLVSITH